MVLRFCQRQPLGILGGPDSGRQRIAGIFRVHHAAALHAFFRTIRAGGKILPFEVAVLPRVGVDDATHGAMLGCDLRLDTSPSAAVTRDHDRALHRNSQPLELLVVARACRSSRKPAARSRLHRSSRRCRWEAVPQSAVMWDRHQAEVPASWRRNAWAQAIRRGAPSG